jgi:hypothetical protein
MIDEAVIVEWLSRLSYRPDWKISYAGRLEHGQYIVILATGQDSHELDGTFRAMPLFKIPVGITCEEFYDWILDTCIPGVDTHERWEWFRVDGQKWRDPHAPGMPAYATDF